MPQAIEAEQPGCAEPVRLTSTVRAVVTILSPIETPVSVRGSGVALLDLLDSPTFVNAPVGNPEQMERDIAANRDAWGD